MPIILSQAPPMCEECGGLKVQVHPRSLRYLSMLLTSRLEEGCNSLAAPTKFVPRSERMCLTGPLMAMKRQKALMKQEVSIDSITSIWTALMDRQVNIIAQRFPCARPPLV